MIKIIKENAFFFYSFLLFLILGMLLLFNIEKGEGILFFNNNRTTFGDTFFKYFTKVGEEPSYILLMILMAFIRFRYVVLIPIGGIAVTIVSNLMKTFFAQPRPITFFRNEGQESILHFIEGVHLNMGNTSFPSGHTMSGFMLFGLLALIIKDKKTMGILLFIVAFFIGLSRIYLIQHFFQDIYLGAICGVLLALFLYWFQSQFALDANHWMNKKLNWFDSEKARV